VDNVFFHYNAGEILAGIVVFGVALVLDSNRDIGNQAIVPLFRKK